MTPNSTLKHFGTEVFHTKKELTKVKYSYESLGFYVSISKGDIYWEKTTYSLLLRNFFSCEVSLGVSLKIDANHIVALFPKICILFVHLEKRILFSVSCIPFTTMYVVPMKRAWKYNSNLTKYSKSSKYLLTVLQSLQSLPFFIISGH